MTKKNDDTVPEIDEGKNCDEDGIKGEGYIKSTKPRGEQRGG